MIQIIGLSETVSLEQGLVSRKEIRVLGPDGREHSIEVPPEVVLKLLSICTGGGPPATSPAPRIPAQVASRPWSGGNQEPEPAPETGEVGGTFGGDVEPPEETSAPAAHAIPRFVEAPDEDGQQI